MLRIPGIVGPLAAGLAIGPVHAAEVVDPAGDAGPSGIDFGTVSAWGDANRFHLGFTTGREIGLQSGSPVVLALDTDNSADTGLPVLGMGADFQWRFRDRSGTTHPFGIAVRVGQAAVGLRQAPTFGADEFEISLDRAGRVAGAPLMPGDTVRVALFVEEDGGDAAPDFGGLVVVLGNQTPPPAAPVDLGRGGPGRLRVLTYNVLFNGLFLRQAEFGRILNALSPDILSLQELRDHSPEETRALVGRMVPGDSWHVADRGFIVSRYPIVASGSVDGERGSTWALVSVPGADDVQNVLVLNPQVPCCDQEEARQAALDRVAAWLRDAQLSGEVLPAGTPVIVAGDLNLVGGSHQYRTIRDGAIVDTVTHGAGRPPDWDGTSLADAEPRHATGPETYTWRDDDSPFAPGRLDFILYTDSVLELDRAFVLWTPDLDAADRARTGLQPRDTVVASDHLPVVADFILSPAGRGAAGGSSGWQGSARH